MSKLNYQFLSNDKGLALFSETYEKLFKGVKASSEIQIRDIDLSNWDQFMIKNYGSPKYSLIILLFNNVKLSELKIGHTLKLISKAHLDAIYNRKP